MLRPERMSRVSVTGAKRVMDEAIGTIHETNLLHVTEYDGAWDGFEPGEPIQGADDFSDKLVTVRAIESILGVTEDDAGPTRIVTDDAIEENLEEIRQEVNEHDDRRSEIEDELRDVEERIDLARRYVDLGLDLDLLSGYESIDVLVGEGDPDTVEAVLAERVETAGQTDQTSQTGQTDQTSQAGQTDQTGQTDRTDEVAVEAFEVHAGDEVVAAFVYPTDTDVEDTLVGVDFAALDVPDAEGDPEEYLAELRHRKQQLASKLDTVEDELEDLRLDVAGFLLAAEEKLTVEVQKREAPLTFATTENAFVAEGWIPTDRYPALETALQEELGDHIEVEELERADYDRHGRTRDSEDVTGETPDGRTPGTGDGAVGPTDGSGATTDGSGATTDGSGATTDESNATTEESDGKIEARPDGGDAPDRPMRNSDPPVIQENPKPADPFELLVEVVNLPRYDELDPTVVLWLTFPAFFGFMIGDVGYGLLYLAIGYWLYDRTDSDALGSLGGVALWSGGFTVLFGILYGEIFGLHALGDLVWGGHPPIEKGLSPATLEYAQLWLIVSLLLGIIHLTVGWILGFFNDLPHGLWEAVTENASWLMLLFGLWIWIFSGAGGNAPAIMVGEHSVLAEFVGFTGFPEIAGTLGLGVMVVGLVLLFVGEGGVGLLESLNVLVNVLSYTRIAAVLLAKAGMAFVVNLLFFGVYVTRETHGGEAVEVWHFGTGGMPHGTPTVADPVVFHGHEVVGIMFGGLVHGGGIAMLFGLVVLVVGHLLVMALGITSAGLQAIRLEYVEFFQKFYQGGGSAYEPFGHERTYTTED